VIDPIDNLWGKSYRFSPLWSNGPQLHGGNPIGNVPAPSRGIIIKFFFVSFVLFVVIFLSRYILLSPSRKGGLSENGDKAVSNYS
jgi:hypothetical protein